jgi:hypothetical protein
LFKSIGITARAFIGLIDGAMLFCRLPNCRPSHCRHSHSQLDDVNITNCPILPYTNLIYSELNARLIRSR